MSDGSQPESALDDTGSGGKLFEVLDGFVEALLAGEPVDVDTWMTRHPELGEELRAELELVASLHETASSVALDAADAGPGGAVDPSDAQPGPATRAFIEPGTALGEHVVEELLGYGGMGEVYRAHHDHLGKAVAVKVLRRFLADDPSAVTRFRDEVRAQASLSPHRNVVTAMHASEHDGRLYLVMEYVAGRDLTKLVREDGPVTPEQAGDYLRQAAEGLSHAHRAGLVHRDVKPSNLILDQKGTVKVVDLGLARLAVRDDDGDGRTSYIDELVGTLDYVSPEQAQDPNAADARSDLYGLGCTLYYLLTGRAPFADRLMLKKLMAHAIDRPSPVDTVRGDVPAGLIAILDRLMAKDPGARFGSADELIDAIDELGLERPPSPPSVGSAGDETVSKKARPGANVAAEDPGPGDRAASASATGAGSASRKRPGPRLATRASSVPDSSRPAAARPEGINHWAIATIVLTVALLAALGLYVTRGAENARGDGDGQDTADAGASAAVGDERSPPFVSVGQPREAVLGLADPRRPKEDSAFHLVTLEVEADTAYAVTLRSDDFDPVLVLRDANGFELATSHDAPGLGRTAEVVVESRDGAATLTLLTTSERATGAGRYLLSARVVPETTLVPGTSTEGELTEGDALYHEDDTLYDRYALRVTAAETYVIIMRGEAFAPAVFVESADRRRLTQSQRTEVDGEARTVFDAEGDGLVYVVANTSARSDGGPYSLSVETHLSGEELVSTAGLLAEGDSLARDESFYDAYDFEAVSGNTYVVTMRSDDFDTYVLIVDPATDERLAQNDDAFGTDSRLVWTAHEDRPLQVWANSYEAGDTGQYQIELRELAATP